MQANVQNEKGERKKIKLCTQLNMGEGDVKIIKNYDIKEAITIKKERNSKYCKMELWDPDIIMIKKKKTRKYC